MSGTSEKSLPDSYFEALYRSDADPWRFASSAYERDKYAASLAALPDRRFAEGFEIGCSIGIFTRALAAKCGRLLAVDVSETALAQARLRCADLAHVQLQRLRAPDEWPDRRFDLIVLSEVLYYLCLEDVVATARKALDSLAGSGVVLLVHWTGETNYPISGDDAANAFVDACGRRAQRIAFKRHPKYRLDLLMKT